MRWFSGGTLKRTYGLTCRWQALPPSLATPISAKSLPAHQYLTLRAISSFNPPKRPTNDEIHFETVRLVDPESGSLLPLASYQSILDSIDHKTHHIELVAHVPYPVVRIVDTRQAREKYKEVKKRAQAVARAQARKEIKVTWGVAAGDLAHKLGKARQELEGGKKVDLVFSIRQGQVAPTKQMMDTRVKGVLDTLADVGKEYMARREVKGTIALYFRPLDKS